MSRLHPNIVLMDAQMPGMSGIEAVRSLKRSDLDYGCAVIILAESSDYRDEALKTGAADFLVKDITRARLIWTIRQVYETRLWRREKPGLVEEAVELVVSPPDDKAQLLRFMWQLEERLRGTYGAAVVARTAGSFEKGAVITVLVLPDALAGFSETVEKMPEVEKVEELLEEDALSTLPGKLRLPLRVAASPSKRMRVTLKEASPEQAVTS